MSKRKSKGNGNALAMMPWFPRDWIAATRHMTLAERGAYRDLLDFQWEMGRLPLSVERLTGLLGVTPEEFIRVWPAIEEKFVEIDGFLINERLEEHRKVALTARDKKRHGAELTNAKRQAENAGCATLSGADSVTLSGAPPSPSPSPSPSHTPSPSPHTQEIARASIPELTDRERHERFMRCMAHYPKFNGRKNLIIAENAADAVVRSGYGTWDDIEASTVRYAAFVKATNRQVMRPENFFANDSEPPCLQDWAIPDAPKAKQTQSAAEKITWRPPECDEGSK